MSGFEAVVYFALILGICRIIPVALSPNDPNPDCLRVQDARGTGIYSDGPENFMLVMNAFRASACLDLSAASFL
jgi:hypothetical protein